jgi:two-component system sensor histidine kinase KdpD
MKKLPEPFRHLSHFLLAVFVVALSSLILIGLRSFLSSPIVAFLYLIPVVVSAALWGRLAGITSSILSFLTFNFLFTPPYYSFRVTHPQDFLAMIVLLSVAFLISNLMARAQSRLEQVQQREREAVHLYQLSVELTGKSEEKDIANALARSLSELLPGTVVEIQLSNSNYQVRIPEADSIDTLSLVKRTIPLVSSRGSQGEIRIFDKRENLTIEEERLLQTFAGQGALALERTTLAASENRAHLLEESDRLKTAILSSVSHEFRTPLASILASATSLFNPNVELGTEARSELQNLLVEETERMIQLVGNLLNMSRIEAGALKLQREWNSLTEILDNTMKRLIRISRQHKIEVDVSDDLPLISVDAVLLEQVLINLVGNSLKFSPEQSTIHIHAREDGAAMKVTVSNQGPPISEDTIEHIFEKFYPVAGNERGRGTGLGLSICKGIVEAHGGRIWAENVPTGVDFNFTIPLSWEGNLPVIPSNEGDNL